MQKQYLHPQTQPVPTQQQQQIQQYDSQPVTQQQQQK